MNRRTAIKLGLAGLGLRLAGRGTCAYLRDEDMDRSAKKEGLVLADLHCHPFSGKNLEETLEMLSSGLIGLAEIEGHPKILNYSQALNLPNVEEIDSELLARIYYDDKVGYILKAQEVQSYYHLLALGLKENILNDTDPRKTVERIHRLGGIAILNHPFVVPTPGAMIKKYRLINDEEEKKVREL